MAFLQHAAGYAKNGPPDPGGRRPDCFSPGKSLSKRFGHSVTGNVRVMAECPDGTPNPIALCTVQGFDGVLTTLSDGGLH